MTFDEFVAEKDAARAARDRGRVTWRRVDDLTGGGYSGYGRGGRLVYVRLVEPGRSEPSDGRFVYGYRVGQVARAVGRAKTLTAAKELAAALTLRDELWSAS